MGHIPTITPKSTHSWSNQFLSSTTDVSVTLQNDKNFRAKTEAQMEKPHSKKQRNYICQYNEVKE